MRALQILEAAAREAQAAASWYEDQRAGLGGEFREAFKQALDGLREGLVPGTPRPGRLGERGVKRILMKRFPFYVMFVAPGTTGVVLAVAHHCRRPGYWRERVSETQS